MNELKKKCSSYLCKICATRGVLPTSYALNQNDLSQPEGDPHYQGGFGVVWKGKYKERAVAIKRLNLNLAQKGAQKQVCRLIQMEHNDLRDS